MSCQEANSAAINQKQLTEQNRRSRSKSKQQTIGGKSTINGSCCSPPFDFLVPINVCVSGQHHHHYNHQQQQNQQQPNVDEQPIVECISWSLFNLSSGKVECNKSVKCSSSTPTNNAKNASLLNEAIQKIDKTLEGKNCVLVTCGPFHLRQHLHPIAKRLKVELSSNFSQYVDLIREFDRCSFGNISGRQIARASGQATMRPPQVQAACCLDSSCCNSSNDQATPATSSSHNKENLAHDEVQETPSSCISQPVELDHAATVVPLHLTAANQQPHQVNMGTRKRFEELLKFLAINVDLQAVRCKACSSANNDKLRTSNCLDCLLALAERQVETSCSIIERLLQEGHSFNRFERIKRQVEVGLCETSAHEAEQRVVRARGLPWQASEQDIADFFVGLNIAKGGVGLCLSRQGRRNGEALIQFESREHRNLALSRHKHFIGNRYIEVYRASGEDFQSVAAGYNNKAEAFISKGAQSIVRMRGLPFTCDAKQVVDFFASTENKTKSCEVFCGEEGVLFVRNHDEKPTGDAFVLFANDEQAKRAIAKHHQNIGTRYVELFRSTVSEVQQVLSISMGGPGAPAASAPGEHQTPARQQQSGLKQHNQTAKLVSPTSDLRGARTASKTKSPVSLTTNVGTNHDPTQLENKSAFPALSESSVVWQRPDAATYAQVAHLKQSNVAPASSNVAQQKEEQAEQKLVSKSDKIENEFETIETSAKIDCNTNETTIASNQAIAVVVSTDAVQSTKCNTPNTEANIIKTNGAKSSALSVVDSRAAATCPADISPNSCSSSSSSTSSTASSSISAGYVSPSAQSPILSSCSSSENSSSCESAYKATQQYPHPNQQHHHHHQHTSHHSYQHGSRRYHHYHRHSNNIARYHPGYVYHQPQHNAAGLHQSLVYNPELLQQHQHQQQQSNMPQAQYPSQQHPLAAYTTSQQHAPMSAYYQQPSYVVSSMGQPMATTSSASEVYPGALDPALTSRRDCIRLRGLPFEAQIEDVLNFLGKHSENILYQGVHMVYSAQGQPTGEAIIQMSSSRAAAATAQEAHRRVMSVGKKQRYIEVIPSSIDDMKPTLGYGLTAFAASRAGYPLHPIPAYAYAANPDHIDLGSPYSASCHAQPISYSDQCCPTTSTSSLPVEPIEASQAEDETDVGGPSTPNGTKEATANSQDSDGAGTPSSSTVAATAVPTSDKNSIVTTDDENTSVTDQSANEVEDVKTDDGIDSPSQPELTSIPQTTTTTVINSSSYQVQQQQAIMAAAQAAAYYPILYYYPPHQQMLTAAAPATNRYH